jgi:hypothetical protein
LNEAKPERSELYEVKAALFSRLAKSGYVCTTYIKNTAAASASAKTAAV